MQAIDLLGEIALPPGGFQGMTPVVVICAGPWMEDSAERLEALAKRYNVKVIRAVCKDPNNIVVTTPVGVAHDADRASMLIYFTHVIASRRPSST